MNDRYLYRAKRTDNGEWVKGSLCYKKAYCFDNRTKPKAVIITEYSNTGVVNFDIDENTICQCSGLKDKNGNLIWENDICDRKEKYPEIVKYHDGDWTLDYSYASNNGSGFNYCNLGFYVTERNCVEVIGNIFDNPELLEVEE